MFGYRHIPADFVTICSNVYLCGMTRGVPKVSRQGREGEEEEEEKEEGTGLLHRV